MNIDAGFARWLSDAELVSYLNRRRCPITDTPAELELLRRFEALTDVGDMVCLARRYGLHAADFATLADAMHGDAEHTAELLGVLGEHAFTRPQTLAAVLKAANQIINANQHKE